MEKKSIILLSGGLDSLVSLDLCKEEYNIALALTFDYGQNPVKREVEASKKISEYYHIEHKVIKLPFLEEITNNPYVKGGVISKEFDIKSVWIPNRNGLFLNIGASFADSYKYTHVIFGANRQEGEQFPDNTPEFVSGVNESFKYSTSNGVEAVAPLINYTKNDIVKIALERDVPLEMAYSCYNKGEKNCGVCESCKNLKSALEHNNAYNYIERLF